MIIYFIFNPTNSVIKSLSWKSVFLKRRVFYLIYSFTYVQSYKRKLLHMKAIAVRVLMYNFSKNYNIPLLDSQSVLAKWNKVTILQNLMILKNGFLVFEGYATVLSVSLVFCAFFFSLITDENHSVTVFKLEIVSPLLVR